MHQHIRHALRLAIHLACILVLAVTSACTDDAFPPEAQGPRVTLQIRTLNDRPVGLIRATWTSLDTGQQVSQLVAPSGMVALDLPVESGPGELTLDGAAPRQLHPFWFPLSVEELQGLDGTALVLIPRQWRIDRGEYSGMIVETLLDPVVEDEADQTLYTYLFGQPHPRSAPTTYRLDLMTWPLENSPAIVAFDHKHGVSPLPVADSIAIWQALNRIEAVYGINLFRPGVADTAWWDDPPLVDPGYQPGVIRLVYDRETWRARSLGRDSLATLAGDLGASAGGGRFTMYQVTRQFLDGGVLRVGALAPFRLADGFVAWETVLAHETLHVLGVGHTFRIPSTQGPRLRTVDPSPQDVAYMEMIRDLLELERTDAVYPSLIPAIAGERKIILGLPALPTLQ